MLLRKRLKAMRVLRGYRHEDVAKLAGFSRSYYTRLEYGHGKDVTCKVLLRLAKALGCKPGDIYKGF